jgi:protein-tyrosine phosphatase
MLASRPDGRPLRILFVCTGNICRSPLAEAIFKHMLQVRALEGRYDVDSAGTHGYHEGELADVRTRRVGDLHGVPVTSVARALRADDFDAFDLLVAMDEGHLRELRAQCPRTLHHKLLLLRDYDRKDSPRDVPDPYYGGFKGFEEIYKILDGCCRRFLDALESGALPAEIDSRQSATGPAAK